MYLLVTARKGISSLQLAKEIGVTQKTAWFVLGRLREACGGEFEKLQGTIEIDETFVGGKEGNKHEHKKLKAGRGSVGKTAVLGMRERGGRTVAMVIPSTDAGTVQNEIHGAVEIGSQLYTDEFGLPMKPTVPPVLDKMADLVLNYRPKDKAKKPRKRKKAKRS